MTQENKLLEVAEVLLEKGGKEEEEAPLLLIWQLSLFLWEKRVSSWLHARNKFLGRVRERRKMSVTVELG